VTDVAPDLLGAFLVFRHSQGVRIGRIAEVEAYGGPEDPASHARRGPTPRSAIMFGRAGIAYVYLIYGMYSCLNVVTDGQGVASAVLIRAVLPVTGLIGRTDGPGRLCRSYGIDRSCNGSDLVNGPILIADGGPRNFSIARGRRIGVDYAGDAANWPWRFTISAGFSTDVTKTGTGGTTTRRVRQRHPRE